MQQRCTRIDLPVLDRIIHAQLQLWHALQQLPYWQYMVLLKPYRLLYITGIIIVEDDATPAYILIIFQVKL